MLPCRIRVKCTHLNIKKYIAPITSISELLQELLVEEFSYPQLIGKGLSSDVKYHFDNLLDSLYVFAESNYIDRVYRDSYYHYYSSKKNSYNRFCIRLSLFDGFISVNDFSDNIAELKKKYRGFIILRPTEPSIIGRSVISPKCLKDRNFISCFTAFNSTINGVKFTVEGFPHSSQDAETISCAETTLWAIMEYFGHRNAEYSPILPSKIIASLHTTTFERQLPTEGLDVNRMSLVLREAGFGSKIYSRENYKRDFYQLISTYISSGIPVLCAIDNHRTEGTIGHAILCIGHRSRTNVQIEQIPSLFIDNDDIRQLATEKNIVIYDWSQAEMDFIFMDDNFPAYQARPLSKPALGYNSAWKDCEITHVIVPLHTKIYLEAFLARGFVFKFLLMGPVPLLDNTNLLIRFFLTSSRTFKEKITLNRSLHPDLKDFILEYVMPQYVWIAELTDKDLIRQERPKASGIIILDATEANIDFNKPLILAAYQRKVIVFDNNRRLEENNIDIEPFDIFTDNLKYPS
jgi:hypothetical protein